MGGWGGGGGGYYPPRCHVAAHQGEGFERSLVPGVGSNVNGHQGLKCKKIRSLCICLLGMMSWVKVYDLCIKVYDLD